MTATPKAGKRARPASAIQRDNRGLKVSIPSRVAAIEEVCAEIRALLRRRHLEPMQFPVELVARECLNNAITHGNRGRAGHRVSLAMRIGRKRICLRIADQGAGFDWRRRHRLCWPAATHAGGRGLLVASVYAQRVAFNRRGNQVTLWFNTEMEGR